MKKFTLLLLALITLAILGGSHYLVRMDRFQAFDGGTFVDIPKGTSTLRIGELLAQAGVIRHPLLFPLARLTRPSAKPLAGEYHFTAPASPAEVFARIARGDVYLVELRVPEGSNVFDIAALVERAGLGLASDFVKAALPHEGFLFPSTYHFRRNSSVESVTRTMRAQFDKVWTELGAPREQQRQTVILASLVETEAILQAERAHIAGVYLNRLNKGMRLECDPTVEYAALLEGRWRGSIHKSDLASTNRYNTYQHAGLPPGPVANAGLASLKAALHPAATGDLFFVARADHSGGHVFSADYAGHQKAVSSYRHGTRHEKAESGSPAVAAKPKPLAR